MSADSVSNSADCVDRRTFSSIRLPCRHRPKHINWKELFAVLYAFAKWSENWSNAILIIFCDNEAVVCGLNKRTIRGAAIHPLRTLFLLAAWRNIAYMATTIEGK